MNARIRQIRKSAGLTQDQFGKSLGATRAMIAVYESGRVVPSDAFVKLMCQTYNINEQWLRTGQGQPNKKQLLPALEKILRNNPSLHKMMLQAVDKLTTDDWRLIDKALRKIVKT